MTKLNSTTQKAKGYIKAYLNADCTSVDYFYNNCSTAKHNAEREIKARMCHANGYAYGYYILGGSRQQYAAGWILHADEDNKHYLIIDTGKNIYKIDVEGMLE